MEKLEFTKAIKSEWLEALKSGKYIQGTTSLRNIENGITKHCCLGVLCEIHPNLSIGPLEHNQYGKNGKEDAVLVNGKSFETKQGTYTYIPFFDMFQEMKTREITGKNDRDCDGKYTAVIPLIEALPTVD